MKKTKRYIIITSILVVSFLISSFLKNELFIADTPELRPYAGEYIVWRAKNVLHNAKKFAFFWERNKPIDKVAVENYLKNNLAPVAKGVHAAEEDNISYTRYTLDEVEYIETTYTLSDGRTITVRSPKGISPPPKQMFEKQ